MGARLNRIDPQDFIAKPVLFKDKRGREYTKMPGAAKKLPREVRAHLYQLDLTVRETKAEIARLLAEHGMSDNYRNFTNVMARIRRERGA